MDFVSKWVVWNEKNFAWIIRLEVLDSYFPKTMTFYYEVSIINLRLTNCRNLIEEFSIE